MCMALDHAPATRQTLSGLAHKTLFDGAGGDRTNYLEPAGDPGLYGPQSAAWRVHSNPVSLAVGGVAAVILELAEPRVRTGVWEHSIFRKQPLLRLRRTGDAAMVTTYGPTAAAEARIAQVTRMHQRVSGATPEGQAYHAMDPDLLTWVHVTAGYGFLNAYVRYVNPKLSREDQDRYYAEGERLGQAFGAKWAPRSVAEVEAYMADFIPNLRPHPIIGEFLDLMRKTSPLGLAGRPAQHLVVEAAIDLLPLALREAAGLGRHRRKPGVRTLVRGMAAGAKRVGSDGPAAQAWRRMGMQPPS